ncbi:MAG TPA: SpoIID/LytB domain-containing protein [Solirubrobacterales bacterium]|nr:SpoIID/LytB domain-containing protein [Solirubrobacterales bacterium]
MQRTRRHPVLARVLAALAALASLAALAPAANAGVNWVVHGRGFGHGVGMSAYGAYGFALRGKDYRFILGHYYSGTTIGALSGTRVVRVLLDISGEDVGFSGATSACGVALDPARGYEAHRSGGAVVLRSSSGKRLAACGRKLRAAGPGKVEIAGVGSFRGALETVPTESDSGSLNVVNALALEQYVKGVMPNEVPASWPAEELKAQAIAVRSFALTGDVDGNGFDLYNDTRSQVYEGLESEAAETNEAVNVTRGQVLMYGGEIAQALYSACSGGHTESVENVFGTAIPYLVGVPDPYDGECPLHKWTLRFSGPEISAKLSAHLDGRLKDVVVTKRGVSPRIIEAKLIGTGGVSTVSGEQLEVALGGYDTWMTFQKVVGAPPK